MRLKIVEVSFTTDEEWLFILKNGKTLAYIFDSQFYSKHSLESPVDRIAIDSWDIGTWVDCQLLEIGGKMAAIKK